MDSNSDGRIDFAEFEANCATLGLHNLDLDLEFRNIDMNDGGAITFAEFIAWVGQRKLSPVQQVSPVQPFDAKCPRRRRVISPPSQLRPRSPSIAVRTGATSRARLTSTGSTKNMRWRNARRSPNPVRLGQFQEDQHLDFNSDPVIETSTDEASAVATTRRRHFSHLSARYRRAIRLLRQAVDGAPSSSVVRGDWMQLQRVLDNELGTCEGSALSVRDCANVLASIGLVLDESQLNATIQNLDEHSSFEVEPDLFRAVVEEACAN